MKDSRAHDVHLQVIVAVFDHFESGEFPDGIASGDRMGEISRFGHVYVDGGLCIVLFFYFQLLEVETRRSRLAPS